MKRTIPLIVGSVQIEAEEFLFVEVDESFDTCLVPIVSGQMKGCVTWKRNEMRFK